MPQSVITLAKQKLKQLEKLSQRNADQRIQDLRIINQSQGELDLMETDNSKNVVIEMLEKLDPDDLSPKQALAYLYQLKKLV